MELHKVYRMRRARSANWCQYSGCVVQMIWLPVQHAWNGPGNSGAIGLIRG